MFFLLTGISVVISAPVQVCTVPLIVNEVTFFKKLLKDLSLCHTFSFVKPISLQPYDVNLWYFKLTLFDLTEFKVWNIQGLRHWVATILNLENQSLWLSKPELTSPLQSHMFFYMKYSEINLKYLNLFIYIFTHWFRGWGRIKHLRIWCWFRWFCKIIISRLNI